MPLGEFLLLLIKVLELRNNIVEYSLGIMWLYSKLSFWFYFEYVVLFNLHQISTLIIYFDLIKFWNKIYFQLNVVFIIKKQYIEKQLTLLFIIFDFLSPREQNDFSHLKLQIFNVEKE